MRIRRKSALSVFGATVIGAVIAPTAANAATSQSIISQPHSVQNQCAQRIYAAQGSGAWEGWRGSLNDMSGESGAEGDRAVNPTSGAAGYYQIMPTTWDDLCSDLGGSSPTTLPTERNQSPPNTATVTVIISVTLDQSMVNQIRQDVREVQQLLNQNGANLLADGRFGNLTKDAVKAFQTQNGLTVNGTADLVTLQTLKA